MPKQVKRKCVVVVGNERYSVDVDSFELRRRYKALPEVVPTIVGDKLTLTGTLTKLETFSRPAKTERGL